MTMPNFFIIGAQKAGTTSLYHYLKQHPQVFMSPVKEPFFFNHEINSEGEVLKERFGGPGRWRKPKFANLKEYRTLFEGVEEEAIGEASVLYICVPGTADRIQRHAPGAKAIALLRNPADRAYSAFLNAVRGGREPLNDFAQALKEEEDRIRHNWAYVFRYRSRGYYHEQLKPYYEVFGSERVGVWLYEDLKEDPVGVAQSVFGFLGVEDTFVPNTSSKHNPASVPRSEAARLAIRFMNTKLPIVRQIMPPSSKARKLVQNRILTGESPPLDPEVRAKLMEGYREDILRLQQLIGRDLSAWWKEEGEG
jgi:hypothetical protein